MKEIVKAIETLTNVIFGSAALIAFCILLDGCCGRGFLQ